MGSRCSDRGSQRTSSRCSRPSVGNADLYDAGHIEIAVQREGGSGVHADIESVDDDRVRRRLAPARRSRPHLIDDLLLGT